VGGRYHPLFLFKPLGDLERPMLRRDNHARAKFWRRVLLPAIERYRSLDIPKFFRGDAAFAGPKLLCLLEQAGFRDAIRSKANAVLERKIPPPAQASGAVGSGRDGADAGGVREGRIVATVP
jgi:hypothetical protein